MATATRKIALNTLVQSIGKVIVTIIAAASVIILTRYLGAEDYGKFNLALVYLQIFGIFADVGLFTIVVREVSKYPKRTSELVGNVLAMRLFLSIIVILVASGISYFLPYEPDVRIAIIIAGVSVLFGLLNSSLVALLQAKLRMQGSVIADTVGRIASFGAVVLVAYLDLGFYAIVATAAVGAFVTLLITAHFARKVAPVYFLFDFPLWKQLFKASLPLGAALALNQIYFRADTFLISIFRSYQEVGLYALSYKVLEIILTFPGFFMNSVFPLLSQYIEQNDERVRSTIQRSADFFLIVGMPIAVGGSLLAPGIVELAGGKEFAGAADPLRVLAFAAALSFINSLFGYALIAKDKQLKALWLNVVGLVFNLSLNIIFIPIYGIIAAAVITVLSEVVLLIGAYFLMKKYFGFFPSFRLAGRVGLAVALMAVPLVLFNDWSVLILTPIGGSIYLAALGAFRVVDRAMLAKLRA